MVGDYGESRLRTPSPADTRVCSSPSARISAAQQQFYEQFTSARLALTELLSRYHVFFGLTVIELRRRAVPLTCQIISDDHRRN